VKRDRKATISLKRSQFDPKFQVKGVVSTNHFCTVSYANECLTTLALTVFTQRNFVADFLHAKCDFRRKSAVLRFRAPLGYFGATYGDHLRLTGKRVLDFLLVLIGLFSLGVMAELNRCSAIAERPNIQANIGSKSAISLQSGPVDPKFQVEGVVPHQPFLFP